jgi:hypothetical protein
VNSVRDIDISKERLGDSMTTARDATAATLRDDVAPAVIAAVEAARELTRPAYEEAVTRLSGKQVRSRSRWPYALAFLGLGAAAIAVVKLRAAHSVEAEVSEPVPSPAG